MYPCAPIGPPPVWIEIDFVGADPDADAYLPKGRLIVPAVPDVGEGVIRNGIDVSAEAHAAVASQRWASRAGRPVRAATTVDGEGEG
ncbi:MAG TPA: hypothetical protein VF183_07340 [Acidimicrobiales bacterium]